MLIVFLSTNFAFQDDYFGEINLLLPTGTPLLILAATDCEVWMLHSDAYANLAQFFTVAVKSRLFFNLKSIMDATVCVFHEEHEIFSPRHLKKYVQQVEGESRAGGLSVRVRFYSFDFFPPTIEFIPHPFHQKPAGGELLSS